MTAVSRRDERTTPRPRAIVTGASSGIGEAYAERLAHDGHDVVLVARRRERLEELAAKLHDRYGVDAQVIVADLARKQDMRTVEQVIAADDRLAILVNNAGFPGYGPVVELDPDTLEEQIDVHITALVRLTRAALPGMIARGRGAVVNLSSAFAFGTGTPPNHLPDRVAYSASKAYVLTFSELLQRELDGTGVQVQALCPGPVRTEFASKLSIAPSPGRGDGMDPAGVAQASLNALSRGEVICVPSLDDYSLVERYRGLGVQIAEELRSSTLAPRYVEP